MICDDNDIEYPERTVQGKVQKTSQGQNSKRIPQTEAETDITTEWSLEQS